MIDERKEGQQMARRWLNQQPYALHKGNIETVVRLLSEYKLSESPTQAQPQPRGSEALANLRIRLMALAEKWDSAEYAISEVNNPLLPQEQCAIELREELQR